jgi:glycerophosphoryl diester phosphodiesterase
MRRKWLWGLLGLIVVLVIVYAALATLAQPAAAPPFFEQVQQRPWVMAHRGGKGLWPENTMHAFEGAVSLGVDVLEMDVHSTADGALVVIHDSTVDRTTEGSGPVQAFTLEELKALDAGYDWSPDDGKAFPFRGQGIAVPTVEEVFAAFPATPLNIEIKQVEPSLAAPLCQMMRAFDVTDSVLVASFHNEVMAEFRRECPEVATATQQNEVVSLFILSKAFLDAAHGRKLQVHAWTINEANDMRRLLALGVDGIITDYPDRLMQLLGR